MTQEELVKKMTELLTAFEKTLRSNAIKRGIANARAKENKVPETKWAFRV